MDGKLDAGAQSLLLLHLQALFIFGTEELVNQLVLARIEPADLFLVAVGVVSLDGVVCYVDTAVAAKLQRIGGEGG